MTATAPQGSVAQLDAPRPDLLVFEVQGKIAKPDIEWMAERTEAAFDTLETIDMLLLLRPWDGMEAGAAVDGEMLWSQLRSVRHVRRYAVVGAPAWARAMINLGSVLSPVEARTFDASGEAWAWLGHPGYGS